MGIMMLGANTSYVISAEPMASKDDKTLVSKELIKEIE